MKTNKSNNDVVVLSNGKKALTREVVNNDFFPPFITLSGVIVAIIYAIIIIVVGQYNPLLYIFGVVMVLRFIIETIKEIRRRIRKYYVIERPCIKKKIIENDDSEKWQLWFPDKRYNYYYGVRVNEECYNTTNINDTFYLVFARTEEAPRLWYKTSEWEIVYDSWKK